MCERFGILTHLLSVERAATTPRIDVTVVSTAAWRAWRPVHAATLDVRRAACYIMIVLLLLPKLVLAR